MGEIYSEKAVNYWLDLGAANTCIREIEAENAELRARLEAVREYRKEYLMHDCNCSGAYEERGLKDPHCEYHETEPWRLDAILSGDGEKGGDLSKKPRNLDISEKRVDGGEKGGG